VTARARVDKVDAGEVPARDPHADVEQRAVCGRKLEADPGDGEGAVAASMNARDLNVV
jgi:hypothetical protein